MKFIFEDIRELVAVVINALLSQLLHELKGKWNFCSKDIHNNVEQNRVCSGEHGKSFIFMNVHRRLDWNYKGPTSHSQWRLHEEKYDGCTDLGSIPICQMTLS